MYIEELKDFPKTDIKLYTEKGSAFHIKTDVFKRLMWYLYDAGAKGGSTLIPLSPERAHEIIKMNKENKKPLDLKDFVEEIEVDEPDYTNVVGQDDLNRFDGAFKRKKKKKRTNKGPGNRPQASASAAPQQKAKAPSANTNEGENKAPSSNKRRKKRPNFKGKSNPNNSGDGKSNSES